MRLVRLPRIGRFKVPRGLARRWRARLRAQRNWFRKRWRRDGGSDVLFPEAGGGMVAVGQLTPAAPDAAPGPRIAILHATAGNGHKRAAQALAAAFGELHLGVTVREADTLVFASRLYRGAYASSYNTMAARAPRLWGVLYHSLELDPVNRGTAPLRLALDRLNLRRLVRVCEREAPDAIVCTHFLPVEALSHVRGRGRLDVPLYCVITDFTAHPCWAFPHVDRYFVATPHVARELHGHGVPMERIEVTGIPVDPRFATPIGGEEARRRFGIESGRPVVLVMGGGSGVGPLVDVAALLATLPGEPRVIVVCGTNHRLRDQIDRLPAALRGQIRTLGFTHEVDVLLEACDAVVSKAGGLTCSEALIKRTPLVIFKPTPGQEVRNAAFLVEQGAAVHAGSIEDVGREVRAILGDAARRERLHTAASALGAPRAAHTIAARVLEATRAVSPR